MATRKSGRRGPAGTIRRSGGKDGAQLVRSGGARWTDQAEELFLDHLGATNNFTAAAEVAGFSRESIYARARRDPGFHERMQAARSLGYGRVEEALARAAEDFLAGKAPDPDSPFPPMTVQDAIAILKLHRPSVTGEGRRPGWRGRPRSLDEVKASILRKLSAIERHRKAQGEGSPDAA